jgi:RNA polymerase sigma-70 factor (ECF subfamily)
VTASAFQAAFGVVVDFQIPMAPCAHYLLVATNSTSRGYPMNHNTDLHLASVYAAHADDVRRWVLRIAGPSVDAEDIVHEVFIVVQRRLHEFRGDAKLTTWLYRITAFVSLRQLRKQRVRCVVHGFANDLADEIASFEPTPCEQLEKKQKAETVHAALDSLDSKHRDVLVLFELDGHNGEEIADLTSTKLATVWVRLHRGRARFRKRMQELQTNEEIFEAKSA